MKRLAALIICLIMLVPVVAQDTPPVITPENAAALTLLESAGSELPVSVSFSPDSRYILAVTTDRTLVYSAENPDSEPQIFPFNTFSFDADGYLVGGGQRWNLDTGHSIGLSPSIRVIRQNENDPAIIEIQRPAGGTIVVQTIITEPITRIAVDDAHRVLAVAIDGNYRRGVSTTTYIYSLPQGNLIAAILEPNDFPITRLHFVGADGRGSLFIESTANFETPQGYVTVIDLPSGRLNGFYSGTIWDGIRFSPGGRFAYALEDKIVHSAGYEKYDRQGIFGTPEFFAVTDSGIAALFDDDVLRLARFSSDGRLSDFEAVPLGSRGPHRLTTTGPYVVLNDDGVLRAWNLRSGSLQPIEIALDPSVAKNRTVQLSPDLERYRYWENDRMIVRDTDTHEILAELPDSAVFSPDWSRAAYFDGKRLTVDDFAAEQDYLHEVNPRHLGRIVDFDASSGNIIFQSEIFVVTNVDFAENTVLTSFEEEYLIGDAQFFGDGECVVSIERNGVLAFHATSDGVDCGEDGGMIANYSEAFAVMPNGGYIVGYTVDCYTPYSYVISYVYPLTGQPTGDLPLLLEYPYGCGRNGFAFTADEAEIYFAVGVLGRAQLDRAADEQIELEDAEILLSYADPVNRSYRHITSVFLSPNEQTIAVYVEDSKGSDWVQERYIEIFALDDLAPGTLRRDVRPLLTIPDATVATFSPDGRYVVTDKGLYSVEFANATPAINGTISAFSPDSQVLATYQDGFVTLWRVPQPNAMNFPLAQYDIGGVHELAFSADGTCLYVIRDGEVQVWGVAP